MSDTTDNRFYREKQGQLASKERFVELLDTYAHLLATTNNVSAIAIARHALIHAFESSAHEPRAEPLAWAEYVGEQIVGVYENSPGLLAEAKARGAILVPLYSGSPPGDDAANRYALRLLETLVDKFGRPPGWQPLPDILGKLTQIDNVVSGLLDRSPIAALRELVEANDDFINGDKGFPFAEALERAKAFLDGTALTKGEG